MNEDNRNFYKTALLVIVVFTALTLLGIIELLFTEL